jgi:hypothetical protein
MLHERSHRQCYTEHRTDLALEFISPTYIANKHVCNFYAPAPLATHLAHHNSYKDMNSRVLSSLVAPCLKPSPASFRAQFSPFRTQQQRTPLGSLFTWRSPRHSNLAPLSYDRCKPPPDFCCRPGPRAGQAKSNLTAQGEPPGENRPGRTARKQRAADEDRNFVFAQACCMIQAQDPSTLQYCIFKHPTPQSGPRERLSSRDQIPCCCMQASEPQCSR